MREIVHIQGGQCGNQIGAKFWEVISDEHGEAVESLVTVSVETRPDNPDWQVLIPPARTMVIPTFSSSASTSITMR